ncbi:hypothetical protein [Motilimonas eburnea]|uniref:hypothetical protein n=1 Tax=Motilimonas eburnea TaxID=1737488 RepID=UPI001E4B714C|nr:hypothetical protein [Motilimonas eburnea]MCE2571785.1 hypothetical protein [Motilimonas eburnea]
MTQQIISKRAKKLTLSQLRDYCKEHNINSVSKYRAWVKDDSSPSFLPSDPPRCYNKKNTTEQWSDWNDLFGKVRKEFVSYRAAKYFVKSNKIHTFEEWVQFCRENRRPNHIPSNPNLYYRDEWEGWKEFLCDKPSQYLPLNEAVEIVKQFDLATATDWLNFCRQGKRPSNIPYKPAVFYPDWKGWNYFLTGNVTKKQHRYYEYNEAKAWAHEMQIITLRDWKEANLEGRRPDYIPANPDKFYRNNGWRSWSHFLG